jgi:hypothetical protein
METRLQELLVLVVVPVVAVGMQTKVVVQEQ